MDKFEQKEMKNKIPIKNIMYGWLTNYIPKSIGKTVSAFKNKVVSLFKTNTQRIIASKVCMAAENQKDKKN